MSKFGAHVSSGNRTGIGEALRQCNDADSPVPLLVSLDQDLWPDVQNYSPSTMLIFRTQPDGNDNPVEMYTGDPVQVARDWYAKCKPKWQQNKAHFYAPTNERNPATELQNVWCDEFDLAMMILADVDGLHLALHGDSVGTLDYPAWQHYQSSLAYASAHGHILLLHEYGLETTLQQAGPDLALRYRKVHDLTKSFAPNLRIAIGEASGGAGYSGEGADWLSDMEWYDSEAMKDSYLIGFATYQLGGAENWYKLIPSWADYVASHPTPIDVPPVIEPRHYDRVCHLVPPSVPMIHDANGNLDPRYLQILALAGLGRESVIASADDAFINPLECVTRKVYVYNVAEYGGQVALEAWVQQYYPPLPEIIYRSVS